jgi:hypothetical protein
MDYGGILRRTWEITWKYKGLWVLGILASCNAAGRGGGGGSPNYQSSGTQGFTGFEDFGRTLEGPDVGILIAIGIGVLCLVFILGLIFLVLGVLGQAGLIAGYSRADQGHDVTLAEAFRLGTEHLWKLLAIRILFWIAGFIAVLTIGALMIPLVILSLGLIVLCLCFLIIPLIILGILIDTYVVLTMVAAVEERLDVIEAFQHSWQVLRDNFWPLLLMALILIVGSGILSFFIFLPFIVTFVPALIGVIISTEASVATGLILSGLCFLSALPILILINGVITTFTSGGWTITYRRLIGDQGAIELGSVPAA